MAHLRLKYEQSDLSQHQVPFVESYEIRFVLFLAVEDVGSWPAAQFIVLPQMVPPEETFALLLRDLDLLDEQRDLLDDANQLRGHFPV